MQKVELQTILQKPFFTAQDFPDKIKELFTELNTFTLQHHFMDIVEEENTQYQALQNLTPGVP